MVSACHSWLAYCMLNARRRLFFAGVFFEQFVLVDHPGERVSGDLIGVEQALFDAEPIDGGLVG